METEATPAQKLLAVAALLSSASAFEPPSSAGSDALAKAKASFDREVAGDAWETV